MKTIRFIIATILFFVILIFLFENYEPLSEPFSLQFDLYFKKWQTMEIPVGIFILLSFLIGFIFASLFWIIKNIKLRQKLRKQEISKPLKEGVSSTKIVSDDF